MIKEVKIENYKSIVKQEIVLGRINIFIGENGSGKSNILEAIAMLSASKSNELSTEKLYNRGIRVTKPSLTFNSFAGERNKSKIKIEVVKDNNGVITSSFINENPDDIYSRWIDEATEEFKKNFTKVVINQVRNNKGNLFKIDDIDDFENFLRNQYMNTVSRDISNITYGSEILDFVIYNINSNALRGISNESKREYLGIFGEGIDILLSTFNKEQFKKLKENNFISWLEDIQIDNSDILKYDGHKLNKSNSNLYFVDKYMKRQNRVFSAENANEGALHVLFYLALFISDKTPNFFGIDNIETALNPKLCRELIVTISKLAKEHNKQALITTHNPAILDGINLHDEDQKLFVVKRANNGQTIIEQVKIKPELVNDKKYKLSELWMRGFIGGLSSSF